MRKAMQDGEEGDLFKGIVELDETFIGGKKTNHSKTRQDTQQKLTGYQDKQPIIGLVERDGRIKLLAIDKAHGKTIKPIIEQTVSKGCYHRYGRIWRLCRIK